MQLSGLQWLNCLRNASQRTAAPFRPTLPTVHYSSNGKNVNNNNNTVDDDTFELPPPPENCCMSNCANCVWIEYAHELERMFHDGGSTAKKLILQKMQDPGMKAFLSLELALGTKAATNNGTKGCSDSDEANKRED